jgi:hypothetical protein
MLVVHLGHLRSPRLRSDLEKDQTKLKIVLSRTGVLVVGRMRYLSDKRCICKWRTNVCLLIEISRLLHIWERKVDKTLRHRLRRTFSSNVESYCTV